MPYFSGFDIWGSFGNGGKVVKSDGGSVSSAKHIEDVFLLSLP